MAKGGERLGQETDKVFWNFPFPFFTTLSKAPGHLWIVPQPLLLGVGLEEVGLGLPKLLQGD